MKNIEQIKSLELTLNKRKDHEPKSERGKRIIAEMESELYQIKANYQELQDAGATANS